ncbi:MAG TPA: carotenoid oxygenase family protein, partial [Anaerolineales bacterium]|nr:carotenoid oxygenase family protein [Anaerolineales bacterium]
MRIALIGSLIILSLLFSACSPAATPVPLLSAIPPGTLTALAPTATRVVPTRTPRPTLPPTETPQPLPTATPTELPTLTPTPGPVEIDPLTLETLGVVGTSWDAEALDGLVPFPPILSTAHPFYDGHTGELFSVNYGRSTASMLETIPLLTALSFLPDVVEDWVGRVLAALGRTPVGAKATQLLGQAVNTLARVARKGARGPIRTAANDIERILPESFLDLVWWDGQGDITRIPVIDAETGKEAAVLESMHQVAVTKRFVLLLDTNFKLRLDQFYNNPFPYVPEVERLLRVALASRQGETSNLWVIDRADVERALSGQMKGVPAFKVRLPG